MNLPTVAARRACAAGIAGQGLRRDAVRSEAQVQGGAGVARRVGTPEKPARRERRAEDPTQRDTARVGAWRGGWRAEIEGKSQAPEFQRAARIPTGDRWSSDPWVKRPGASGRL